MVSSSLQHLGQTGFSYLQKSPTTTIKKWYPENLPCIQCISLKPAFFEKLIRDDKHMTSMKIVQFSRPATPLNHLRPKFFHTLDIGRLISNELHPSPKDNQSIKRKHNLRMTAISYQVLISGGFSFSVSTH